MSFIASAITEAGKASVAEIPKEVGNKMKDSLPDFFKNLKPVTASMEKADLPLTNLSEQNNDSSVLSDNVAKLDIKQPLTDQQKETIKQETGWSDLIVDSISCYEEYEVYSNAGLSESEINGKPCLVKEDIDWDRQDSMGRTNKERAENGLSPIGNSGETLELHHIGQKSDSPLAELTTTEHRGSGNDSILHDKTKPTEIDRDKFAIERKEHWENRATV